MEASQLIITGIYFALIFGIGIYATRFVKDSTDFLLAGRRLGLVLATAALAAHFGGGFVVGTGEWGYTYGLTGMAYAVGVGLALLILAMVAAKRMRRLGLVTVPDYLEYRYKSKTARLLGALLSLVAIIGILGAQVWASQGALSILGIDPDAYFHPLGAGGPMVVAAILPAIMYTLIGQDFYQRLFAARDEKIAVRAAALAGLLLLSYTMYAAGVFVPVVLGLYWQRGTAAGAMAGIAGGSLAGLAAAREWIDVGLLMYSNFSASCRRARLDWRDGSAVPCRHAVYRAGSAGITDIVCGVFAGNPSARP